MEIKQVVVVSPISNAFRQKGLMSSGRSLATLFKPLNAELNPICHLLVLLGDLTFMDP
jgi:hypothetical protein